MLRPFVVTKKTGFKNNTPNVPINIRDARGIMFYSTESILPVYEFNLPPGKYFIDSGSFTPLLHPIHYKLANLPRKERNYKKPFDFKVVFGNNPNKCSIIWGLKTIIFDNKLKEKSYPILFFILFHEYAHACYKSEVLADRLSSNYMKEYGFNPSQIGRAPLKSLSSSADNRKLLMIKNIIKHR